MQAWYMVALNCSPLCTWIAVIRFPQIRTLISIAGLCTVATSKNYTLRLFKQSQLLTYYDSLKDMNCNSLITYHFKLYNELMFCSRREFIWYKYPSQKVYHVGVEIFKLNQFTVEDLEARTNVSHIICCSDARIGDGHTLKVRITQASFEKFPSHMV